MLIVVDTGGTKTLVSSFNRDGRLGEQVKFATPTSTKEYIKTLTDTIKNYAHGRHIAAIVIATPGIIKDGVIKWAGGNLGKVWPDNFRLVRDLTDALKIEVPIYLQNDAKLAGLGETRLLRKIPAQSLYVTISTGIGSGIITDGKINEALQNSEAGQALFEYDGKLLPWEKFASGRFIYEHYHSYARDITSPLIWHEVADRIARGFLAVIPILQPDLIIIGGSIGTYFERYGDFLINNLEKKLPSHIPCPKIIQAKHPELAVLYGCYYYAIDRINNQFA